MNKKKIEKRYNFTKSDTESMLKELKKFINTRRNYESVKWAIDCVDVIDSYEIAIRFLIDIALTIKEPRYKNMALDKILLLLKSEDLTKEYLKELINPLKEVLIENDDEWVSLRALQIYDKLTIDAELIISKAIELIKRRLISEEVKEEAFWLVKNKEISLEDIEKEFLATNDLSAKFWFAFLLYSMGKLEFRTYLEGLVQRNELNDGQISFWNSQATKYSFPEIDIPLQEEELQKLEIKYKREIFQEQLYSTKELYKRYKSELDNLWKDSPYDRSIFIMMPFREKYEEIASEIKSAAKVLDFQAFLVTDEGRKGIRPSLWENLVINMLSCKYGIAILPQEEFKGKIKESDEENIIKKFHNPNVTLEFGFMYAKGEGNVLIFTNEASSLPADLRGLLIERIPIENSQDKVFRIIVEWLKNKKNQ